MQYVINWSSFICGHISPVRLNNTKLDLQSRIVKVDVMLRRSFDNKLNGHTLLNGCRRKILPVDFIDNTKLQECWVEEISLSEHHLLLHLLLLVVHYFKLVII